MLGFFCVPMKSLYSAEDMLRLSGALGNDPSKDHGRSAFRKDYARLLHAPSFRRLQGKTQLFPGAESDFFRNRLTHSLEVAQIAAGIAEHLNYVEPAFKDEKIDLDLVEFASIAHDLGHPPFGHNGEKALDEMMLGYGGFEGNAQTLRILTRNESKLVQVGLNEWSSGYGLNLTCRSLASILKYDKPIPIKRSKSAKVMKGYYISEADVVVAIKRKVAGKFRGKKFKTIECSIMDLADDIAYSTYDLEDSLHAGFMTPVSLIKALIDSADIRTEVFEKTNKALAESSHRKLESPHELLEAASTLFDLAPGEKKTPMGATQKYKEAIQAAETIGIDRALSTNALARTQFTAERVGRLICAVELAYDPFFPQLSRVRLSRDALLNVEILKHLNFELVIRSPRLAVVEHRGKDIVRQLFAALEKSKGELLPDDWRTDYAKAKSILSRKRVICDFVAGMTDRYAAEFHNALFGSGKSLFKPL